MSMESPQNLVELFENSVARYGPREYIGTKNAAGEYEWITYAQAGKRVDDLRAGLAAEGLKKGDTVGIIANNRVEWAIAAFATYGLGCRFVPMYEAELPSTWQYIIRDSGIAALFVSRQEILDKVEAFRDKVPNLKKVYLIEGEGPDSMAALEALGRDNSVPSVKPESPDEIAVLIYTSGTTGEPKGVLLSHGNLTSNVIDAHKCFPEYDHNDRSLAILPWAHSYGLTADLNHFTYLGGSLALVGSVETIAEDLQKAKPTALIAVPRIFNRVYEGIWAKMDEEGGIARKLFVMAVDTAKKRRELAAQGRKSALVDLKFKALDAVVFKKIRERFGGRLKAAITGSAMMNPEVAQFFFDIGIPTYDCYGLTETSPAVTMNRPGKSKIGTVGAPIPNCRIVIDTSLEGTEEGEGEIIVYGPMVMKGYHNKPEATAAVMTEDGGFRTGDCGKLDEDGFLKITGRVKEQYKLLNGKYVFPAAIEEDIGLEPMVANAMIYGENRDFNVCLLVPDFEAVSRITGKKGDPAALAADPEVTRMIEERVVKALRGKYGGYEIPKKFIFLTENFTLENGMLTQTLKLKRRAVVERYRDQIEAAYA